MAIVDDAFSHLAEYPWHRGGRYAVRAFKKQNGEQGSVFLHHAIVGHPLNGLVVDHVNGDGLDNRLANLRIVTSQQNSQNMNCHRGPSTKTSKYVGVSWHKVTKKWVATINLKRRREYLGLFNDEYQAHLAYLEACK